MAQFSTTQRGKPKLLHDGFQYRIRRELKSKTSWTCSVYGCPGRGTSSKDPELYAISFETSNSNHNHGVVLTSVRKDKVTTDILESVSNNVDLSNRVIANRIIWSEGMQTAALFENFSSLYGKMRRHREKIINPRPYVIEELKLGDRLTKTKRGDTFYQFGPGVRRGISFEASDDMVIFYDQDCLSKLWSKTTWAIDGTFFVVPKTIFPAFYNQFHRKRRNFSSSFCFAVE